MRSVEAYIDPPLVNMPDSSVQSRIIFSLNSILCFQRDALYCYVWRRSYSSCTFSLLRWNWLGYNALQICLPISLKHLCFPYCQHGVVSYHVVFNALCMWCSKRLWLLLDVDAKLAEDEWYSLHAGLEIPGKMLWFIPKSFSSPLDLTEI